MTANTKISAIILAAGSSRRMGDRNKLIQKFGGQPMIRTVVKTAIDANVSETIVVTGFESSMVSSAIDDLPIRIVHNPQYDEGMSASLRTGLEAISGDAQGAVILLADMPRIQPSLVRHLIDAFLISSSFSIFIPIHQGRRGNPVLWGRQHFEALKSITGDRGGRTLLQDLAHAIREVPVEDDSVLIDLDTSDDFAKYR